MEGYQREKNSQAILATNLTALHRHRNSLKEKKQMKNKKLKLIFKVLGYKMRMIQMTIVIPTTEMNVEYVTA